MTMGLTGKASLLLLLGLLVVKGDDDYSRILQIRNDSGRACEVYWINLGGGNEAYPMKVDPPLEGNGDTTQFNTFVTHQFECREAPDFDTGYCNNEDKSCSVATVVVPEGYATQGVLAVVDSNFQVNIGPLHADPEPAAPPRLMEFVEVTSPPAPKDLPFKPVPLTRCLDILQESKIASILDASTAQLMLTDVVQCMQSNVTHEFLGSKEVLTTAQVARKNQVGYFENYTCADNDMPTTPSLRQETWYNPKEDASFQISVLHDRPSSQVHVLENFISPEECEAMEMQAQPLLHKATVADGKGGSTLSPNRKAMQAGITVPWHKEAEGDPIARLSRRVYDYANHVLGFQLKENGQEDLMSIQYFGRGANDTEPDRYMPHCDGDCDGRPHKFGNRMATMVLYCTVPEVGGATNFRNAGIHIKPKTGAGTFFSYIDPKTMHMDSGFTEHSGCPVVAGDKKIVTQWIRLGVDDENPWDSFNTLGLKKTDEDEQG